MTYKEQLDWLITMSKHPGFKAHAWHRAQELDKELFTGIAKELEAHMLKYNSELKRSGN